MLRYCPATAHYVHVGVKKKTVLTHQTSSLLLQLFWAVKHYVEIPCMFVTSVLLIIRIYSGLDLYLKQLLNIIY